MRTHQHGAQGPSSPPPVSTKYDMSGTFLEVCDCRNICPCWTGDSPDEGECTGVSPGTPTKAITETSTWLGRAS